MPRKVTNRPTQNGIDRSGPRLRRPSSDSDVLFSLESEHRACLGRRRDLETEFFEQAANLSHLFCIARREPAALDE